MVGGAASPADTDYPDPRGERDAEADPGLLYAGQWQECGIRTVTSNRFRYYEPETGMYLVSDPWGCWGVSRLTGMCLILVGMLILWD